MKDKEQIIRELVATKKWSEPHARVAVRAKFRCEYCDLDLLMDPHKYKLWQIDHIIPKQLVSDGDDADDSENWAIACKPCNVDFKWTFDPRPKDGQKFDRATLISEAKKQIARKR